VATLETSDDRLLIDATDAWGSPTGTVDFPPPLLVTECGPPPGMDAPSAIVIDPRGDWLFIADHNSDAVAVLSATRRSDPYYRFPDRGLVAVVPVGARPAGLALSADAQTLYVHAAFDYAVAVMKSVGPGPGDLRVTKRYTYAKSPLPADVERGRRLFYSAVDPRMTQPELGGVSCSSCHPDGRTDGLTWRFSEWSEKQGWGEMRETVRNTPALWGVADTAPYHWDGMIASLPAFSARMVETMGGAGLGTRDTEDLGAYMKTIRAPAAAAPAPSAAEGRRLFEGAAGCAACHAAPLFTDRKAHALSFSMDGTAAIDTPSLRGLRATPPYLHDGTAPTLKSVLARTAGVPQHRVSETLTAGEVDALVAYLETL
jgi:cytochrome c peroxidase